jgi:hypothetical protein
MYLAQVSIERNQNEKSMQSSKPRRELRIEGEGNDN